MKDKTYSFNTSDAINYGIDAAVILHNMRYWLDYAAAHGEMEKDGFHWMFASASKMTKVFPFWSSNKIQKLLKKLEDGGVIISGSFNDNKFDRTKWYTMPEYSIQPNGGIRISQNDESTFSEMAESPYVQYKDSNKDILKDLCEVETSRVEPPKQNESNPVTDIFNYWVLVMNKKPTTTQLTTKRKKNISARLKDGYTVEQIKQAVDGCRADPFSMGANDRNKPFNDIELICRTGEKLESFLEVKGNGTNQQSNAYAGMSSAQRQFEEAKRARDSKQSGLSMATNDRDVLGQVGQEEWSGRTFDMD